MNRVGKRQQARQGGRPMIERQIGHNQYEEVPVEAASREFPDIIFDGRKNYLITGNQIAAIRKVRGRRMIIAGCFVTGSFVIHLPTTLKSRCAK